MRASRYSRRFLIDEGIGRCGLFLFTATLLLALLLACSVARAGEGATWTVARVKPSTVNAADLRNDVPHLIAFASDPAVVPRGVVLFLPGTGGKPRMLPVFSRLLKAGYRVISLSYDNSEAIQQLCPRMPDLQCASKVREKRIYGRDTTDLIDDKPTEAIAARLTSLLRYLDGKFPAHRWENFLRGDEPDWEKFVVSGQSQGAGMAAYIAKRSQVARVVLFSSPWDYSGAARQFSPWLEAPSATPSERWYGAYHAKEKMATLISRAYAILRVPKKNILVLSAEPAVKGSPDPYHTAGIASDTPADAAFLFGLPEEGASQAER